MTESTGVAAGAMPLRLRPLFIAVVLTGSFLLFLIQPMFARMVLPRLGGSPSVWNVAMLFYQGALLGGYLYAHALQRLALRRQVIVHVALLGVAALFLPIAAADWLPDPGGSAPALWLLALLAVSIGPVFFMVSSQAPLMQAWFAKSDDPAAAAPTFLYAASNAGSLAALLAYPLLVEPTTRLATQGLGWSIGFGVLLVLVGVCGVAVLRQPGVAATMAATAAPVTNAQRRRWTVLALVPSGLLLSTTTHLTTDVMAMPLLWVIPLAVYLLSFIIAFSPAGARATRIAVAASPVLLILFGTSLFTGGVFAGLYAVSGVLLLFAVATALHGTLAQEQPAAGRLTEYYLWISVGGALGGLFCALIAPMIFNWGYEHPLLLLAAAVLIPAEKAFVPAARWMETLLVWVAPVISLAVSWAAFQMGSDPKLALAVMPIFIFAALSIGRRWLFALQLLMLMLALGGWGLVTSKGVVDRTRSFFGIYATVDSENGLKRTLFHGTTIHGVESLRPDRLTQPTTYFAPESGAGRVFAAAPALFGPAARIGYIGLGAGTLTCYAKPGQTWTSFEIDPAVVSIARDRNLFSYIARCKPDMEMVTGDARLMLAKSPPARFDLLAVDAFSSDAIPLHLITQEAFGVYRRVLADNGVLMVHITNRYLDLEPVVAAIAEAQGWTARVRLYLPPADQPAGQYDAPSTWIVLAQSPERLDEVLATTGSAPGDWKPLREKPGTTAWSDDFASILPVMKPIF